MIGKRFETLRYSWWYRFAHRPLCARFSHGAFRIGRLRLCRGCTWLYLGVLGGVALSVIAGTTIGAWPAVALLAGSLALSHPRVYRRLTSSVRAALRICAGAGGAVVLLLPLHGEYVVPAVAAVAFILVRRRYVRIRADLKRSACEGCPELGAPGICSGYALQAEAFRVYRDRIDDELNADNSPPPVLSIKPRPRSAG